MKLGENIKKNTCPRSSQCSERANIPPDETLLKEINAEINSKAEQGFVGAIEGYHKRRLNNQISKLKKLRANIDVNQSTRVQSHSASTETPLHNNVNKAEKLQQDFDELKQLLYAHLLQKPANNKNFRLDQPLLCKSNPQTKYL